MISLMLNLAALFASRTKLSPRLLCAAAFAVVHAVAMPANAQSVTTEKLAYEVYIGCWNQSLLLERANPSADSLRVELEGCRQLGRRVLVQARSRASDRYLAYLLLLGTDGGESEQNNEAVDLRRAAVRPVLRELERKLPLASCLAPGTRLADKSPDLCASGDLIRSRIDLHLAR